MDKHQRLDLFLMRMRKAPDCASLEEALALVESTLNGVEDEFTSTPFNPALWQSDGRLYPPQNDQRREVPGHPEIVRFRSYRHNTWIAINGAICITERTGQCVLDKPGIDGRTISAMMRESRSTA